MGFEIISWKGATVGNGTPVAKYRDILLELCNKSSEVAEMGDRLATIDMGQKVGADMPLSVRGELGPNPHLTQGGLGRGLLPYQVPP